MYRFLGYKVIADNHIGDWGTGFGMILFGYKRDGDPEKLKSDPFGHLESIYQRVREEAKTNPEVNDAAKRELVLLQQGDAKNRELWEQFLKYSLAALDVIYKKLGVHFDYTLGESAYNDALPGVVANLQKEGIARESEGAIGIFSDGKIGFKRTILFLVSRDGKQAHEDIPLIVLKSDGGYNYATTDLATIQYRNDHFQAKRVIYVVDGRQQMHFKQLFGAAKRWGYGDRWQLERPGSAPFSAPTKSRSRRAKVVTSNSRRSSPKPRNGPERLLRKRGLNYPSRIGWPWLRIVEYSVP